MRAIQGPISWRSLKLIRLKDFPITLKLIRPVSAIQNPAINYSNPVVCYDGMLRSDLYGKMKDAADSADLVIVLGTSLSGLNSDHVAVNPSRRSLQGKSLGTVIINLQQTIHDGSATLRIFAETDKVFENLLFTLRDIPLFPSPIKHTLGA